jgi:hypothetical protein
MCTYVLPQHVRQGVANQSRALKCYLKSVVKFCKKTKESVYKFHTISYTKTEKSTQNLKVIEYIYYNIK